MSRLSHTMLLLLISIVLAGWLANTQLSLIRINSQELWQLLTTWHVHNMGELIIAQLRLPRFVMALIVGSALACSGCTMQAITTNPLASPSLFGVNAGAALGLVVATLFAIPVQFGDTLLSMAGAALCWGLVMLIGAIGQASQLRLILAGVMISTFCGALTKALLLFHESSSHSLLSQLAGSLAGVRWPVVQQTAVVVIPLCLLLWMLSSRLNLFALGSTHTQLLGIATWQWQFIFSLITLILVASIVSHCGYFGFVGLIVPHLARRLVGHRHQRLIPCAALLGASLVCWADLLSRAISFPTETPAGAVLALIGAPFFLYLVRRQ
ncbi:FecCD family ABC transporter permease [Celerinatantimonas diazotrophica]|uniref:Iron complex transport system permease protein n=1 Tax=Celerinatantimonas diazotrophica TaxID=412034 RepID=A0A4R1J8Z7_9GAMM|nr:iron chelate uptake ABC transporter family permease subunit [Celerinatantimonas diazotrophica]TCK46545.1 iron complex transport system permease protein [Celerinatantimonas diazotrophica]CAG9296595.1 Fe(3+) dicitrate transport system permease protein FecC [Celerinatantimonas diazotrophica]